MQRAGQRDAVVATSALEPLLKSLGLPCLADFSTAFRHQSDAQVHAWAKARYWASARKSELAWERQRKKVANETKALQHELRKTSAEGLAHEQAIKAQREAVSKQERVLANQMAREAERQEAVTLK